MEYGLVRAHNLGRLGHESDTREQYSLLRGIPCFLRESITVRYRVSDSVSDVRSLIRVSDEKHVLLLLELVNLKCQRCNRHASLETPSERLLDGIFEPLCLLFNLEFRIF